MSVIRWKSFGAGREASLCVSCVWGTVRQGYRSGEVEAFCRLVGPNGLVPFPVRECTGYADGRVPVNISAALSSENSGAALLLSESIEQARIRIARNTNPA